MTSILTVSLLLACLVAGVVSDDAPKSFNFHNYLQGEWDLQRSTTSLETLEVKGAPEEIHYSIQAANESIVGKAVEADKEEELQISVEFEVDQPHRGSFYLSSFEEPLQKVFRFDFVDTGPAHLPVSYGRYNVGDNEDEGKSRLTYQLIVTSPTTFVLNVWDEENHQLVTTTAHKIVEKAQSGFFQKFGMPIMLFGMIMLSQFMKNRQARAAQAPATEARQDTPRPGRREGPTVEEITEGEGEATEGDKTKSE